MNDWPHYRDMLHDLANRIEKDAAEIGRLRKIEAAAEVVRQIGPKATNPDFNGDAWGHLCDALDAAGEGQCQHQFTDGQQDGERGRWCLYCGTAERRQ